MGKSMKRVLTLVLTFSLLLSMLVVSVSAKEARIDKTAEWADDAKQIADVTLSVPGDVKIQGADIVFVIDKSSCGKYATAQFKEMFEELAAAQKQSGATIKVGVVVFNYTDHLDVPLTELTSENVDELLGMIGSYSGGTNMESGLLTAKKMLDADDSVAAENKHVILISDGYTWAYDDENGDATTILWKNGNGSVGFGTRGYSSTRGVSGYQIPNGYTWASYWAQIQEWVEADGNAYDYNIADYDQSSTSAWNAKLQSEGAAVALTFAEGQNHAVNMDRAMYDAWKAFTALQNAGYSCYVNSVNTSSESIGYHFMNMLAGEQKPVDFESIKNTIIYYVSKGSYVKDVIGYGDNYNFDFITDPETITLTVAEVKYNTTKLETAKEGFDASYEFTAPGAAEATFTLDYVKGNGTSEEMFIWTFGEDLSAFYPAKLDYQVELVSIVNNPAEAKAVVDTNKSATLYPKDSDGNEGTPEEFPVPQLNIPKYKVSYVYTGVVPSAAPAAPSTKYYFAGDKVYTEGSDAYKVTNYIFNGWNDPCNDLADGIMPAHDVTLIGSYIPVNENVDPPIVPPVHTLGSIVVTKNATGATTPADATFQLQKMEGNDWTNVGEAVAYSAFVDGACTFAELEEGTYRVVESGAEIADLNLTATYSENAVLNKTTAANGDTTVGNGAIFVTNTYTEIHQPVHTQGSIVVIKNATGATTPADATFQLQKLNGEAWENIGEAVAFSSFANNAYNFTGLAEGTYRVVESNAEIEDYTLETTYSENVVLTETVAENGDTSVSSGTLTVTNNYDEELIEIPDEDPPLADVPKTGDMILPFVGMAIVSGMGAIFMGKKKEDKE